MKRLVLSTLLGASLMHCTQPKPEALQQEQAQERTALAQRQAEQLAQAQRTAQENLDRETRSAQTTQQQAAVDIQRLEALMTQACAGIENARREQCPVGADSVAVVQDVASGVSLRMQSSAGTRDQFNHRVECYRAWGTVRNARSPAIAAPLAPTACLIDVPGINMQLRDTGGTLDVERTTADNGRVDLRTRAHLLDRHPAT